jgi:hypothetical protein
LKSPKGVSLKRLHDIEADDISPADTRPADIAALTAVSAEVLDAIGEVFSGTGLMQDERKVKAILDARRAVGSAWDRAARSFVEIGRALNALDAQLRNREEKARLKAGFEKLFPFSEPVSSQFRRVAEMVDSGRVAETQLPGSYSAAYQVALLEPDELEAARQQGLIAPNTSRSAVIAFRRSIVKQSSQVDLGALEAEARRIRETRRRLLQELIRLRGRASEISRLLETEPDAA